MPISQIGTNSIASGTTLAAPTFSGTSTFSGGIANAYGFGVGTAVPSSGSGIAFPATQNPSSDANTLDDYEEGTFNLSIAAGSGTITSYTTECQYIKVGRLVMVQGIINITNNGTGASYGIFSGLPFTISSSTDNLGCGVGRMGGTTGKTTNMNITKATTGGQIWYYDNTYPFANGAALSFTLSYICNA